MNFLKKTKQLIKNKVKKMIKAMKKIFILMKNKNSKKKIRKKKKIMKEK